MIFRPFKRRPYDFSKDKCVIINSSAVPPSSIESTRDKKDQFDFYVGKIWQSPSRKLFLDVIKGGYINSMNKKHKKRSDYEIKTQTISIQHRLEKKRFVLETKEEAEENGLKNMKDYLFINDIINIEPFYIYNYLLSSYHEKKIIDKHIQHSKKMKKMKKKNTRVAPKSSEKPKSSKINKFKTMENLERDGWSWSVNVLACVVITAEIMSLIASQTSPVPILSPITFNSETSIEGMNVTTDQATEITEKPLGTPILNIPIEMIALFQCFLVVLFVSGIIITEKSILELTLQVPLLCKTRSGRIKRGMNVKLRPSKIRKSRLDRVGKVIRVSNDETSDVHHNSRWLVFFGP